MLTESQQTASDTIISALIDGQECSLTGLAGTGKTTVSGHIYSELTKLGLTVCAMAPTAKAALVLQGKGIPACTIHSAIYNYRGKKKDENNKDELIFVRNNGRLPFDILMVDEGSMVGAKLARDIRFERIPTLWIGDPGQLPPVKSAKSDVLGCGVHCHLREIHRQAAGSPIIQFAHKLRQGERLDAPHTGINRVEVNGGGAKRIVGEMARQYISTVIVKTNAQRHALNAAYRDYVGREDIVDGGEEIVVLANNYSEGVVNGERFLIPGKGQDFGDGTTHVEAYSETGHVKELILWNDQFGHDGRIDTDDLPDDVVLADYAYAVTCHKMQGSSAKHVGIVNKGWCGEDTKRWNYTAATRAEENITVFY